MVCSYFTLTFYTLLIGINFASASMGNESFVNCTEYKEMFAFYVGQFSYCAIDRSRPITLCESCIDQYLAVLESYSNFTNFEDASGKCILNYVNLDRLQIVNTLYATTINLWNKAKCYECFEIINGSLTHNLSQEAVIFNDHYSETWNCINTTVGTNEGEKFKYCTNCLQSYLKLNDYYYNISNINENIASCMDMVDLMNGTRTFWSTNCCKYREHTETIFYICTGLAFLLTAIFYLLTKFCTDIKAPAIFQQSRFAESFNTLSQSTANS